MMVLTTQEMIILWILIVAVMSIIGCLVRKGIRLIATIALVFIITSLAVFWLPGKLEHISNGDTTIRETIDDVSSGKENDAMYDALKDGHAYVQDNYVEWGDAFKNLMHKIIGDQRKHDHGLICGLFLLSHKTVKNSKKFSEQ